MHRRPFPTAAGRQAWLFALLVLVLSAWTSVRAAGPGGERRVALVIGNGAYAQQPLKNPVNDARAVSDNLKQLGFQVTYRQNAGQKDMIEAVRQFSLNSRDSDVRLFFYAGHGVQVDGRNFLIPVDSRIEAEDEIPRKGVDVTEMVERLAQFKDGLNLVILDACRNNPFDGGVITTQDGRRIRFRGPTPSGLAAVDAPIGTLIAFSTAPGAVAMDGVDGRHSLYVKNLLKHMDTPGLPIEQMFKRVRIDVAQQTRRQQVPWESSSLMGDFCFQPGPQGTCVASNSLFRGY